MERAEEKSIVSGLVEMEMVNPYWQLTSLQVSNILVINVGAI